MSGPDLQEIAAFLCHHCARETGTGALYLPGWTTDDWATLLAGARVVDLAPSEVLIRRGLEAEHTLFLVTSGSLEVNARGGSGSLGGLFREGPGALIGEIAFFDGGKRSATVWALKPTRLLALDRQQVEAYAARHPQRGLELLFAVGRVLAFHVRRSEQRAATDAF